MNFVDLVSVQVRAATTSQFYLVKHRLWYFLAKMRGFLPFLIVLLVLQPSCFLARTRKEPSYPPHVANWQPYRRQGVPFCGSFVLKKHESTSNGILQVRLLDLLPPDWLAESGAHNSLFRARLQFVRVADSKLLCENNYAEGEGGNLAVDCGDEIEKMGVLGIGVRAVNLKEGWVFFELSGGG